MDVEGVGPGVTWGGGGIWECSRQTATICSATAETHGKMEKYFATHKIGQEIISLKWNPENQFKKLLSYRKWANVIAKWANALDKGQQKWNISSLKNNQESVHQNTLSIKIPNLWRLMLTNMWWDRFSSTVLMEG